jgi:hypothetical protein
MATFKAEWIFPDPVGSLFQLLDVIAILNPALDLSLSSGVKLGCGTCAASTFPVLQPVCPHLGYLSRVFTVAALLSALVLLSTRALLRAKVQNLIRWCVSATLVDSDEIYLVG